MSSPRGPGCSGRSPRGTHTPAHSTTATPRTGTLAKVLEKCGRRHRWSVLSGRQTHSFCPESRNFSKPAIIMPSWRQPADPTLVGRQPSPDPSQALRRVPSRPAAFGCPRDRGCVLRNSGTANHPTQQETSGFGLTPVQDFCLMAIFLPSLSFLSSAKFPQTALQHPNDTETAGNSPQSKEGKTHNSPPTAACPVQPGLCNWASRFRRE